MQRAAPTFLLVLGLAFAVAACGDSPPSKSEYLADADKICKAGDKKSDEIGKDVQADSPATEKRAALKEVGPVLNDTLSDLRGLDKPEGDGDELDKVYDAVEDGIKALDDASETPEKTEALLQGSADPFEKADKLAKGYGFKECGS